MRWILLISFTVLAFISKAENEQPSKADKSFELHSDILNETRNITVYFPVSYAVDTATKYPVIYVLDGESNGALVAEVNRRMVISGGAKEQLVVAIHSTDRIRDYAPTVNRDPRGPIGAGGGGDKFLQFLKTELMPVINAEYRTNTYNAIAGHSVAGLLVVHSFHAYPELFQAHLAFSPAVWWGARETSVAAQDYIVSGEVYPGYLYLNIGNEAGEMRDVYNQFEAAIRKNRPLDLSLLSESFNYDSHGLTFPAGLYNALRGMYQHQVRIAQEDKS